MLILNFHPGMTCLHVFFSFFHSGTKFHPCLSSRDEISFRHKRVNSKRHFTIDRDDFIPGPVSSRYEISRVNTPSYIWCIYNLVCVIIIQKFLFFLFLIWMRTFQTDNRTFKITIMSVDQCSLDCCSGVFISTLSKYLSDKLYYYTSYAFFLDYD